MKDLPKFRTRYAPSPTGFLHLGNARTALFCYLLAQHYKGAFIIRIEDTDVERNIQNGVTNQLEQLQWLGIQYDEGPLKENPKYAPYWQSKRLEIYKKYLNELEQKGIVYPCYCSKEVLEQKRKKQMSEGKKAFMYDRSCLDLSSTKKKEYEKKGIKPVFRFKVPNSITNIIWHDLVRGKVNFKTNDIEDFIIVKSNGFPVYNFANVIDDHLMEITHVVRGEEHLSNTPKQILLYKALSWNIPKFAHLSIIVNKHYKKLSKRDQNEVQFISQYKQMGIVPQAVFNYLSFLGWTSGEEKEIYTKKELIDKFCFKRISKAPAQFNMKKLLWFNKEYLKHFSKKELHLLLVKTFKTSNYKFQLDNTFYSFEHFISYILGMNEWTLNEHKSLVYSIIDSLSSINFDKKRIDENKEVLKKFAFLNTILTFINKIEIIEVKNNSKDNNGIYMFKLPYHELKENVKRLFKNVINNYHLQPKLFFQTTRKYFTNSLSGPDLWKIIIVYKLVMWRLHYEQTQK